MTPAKCGGCLAGGASGAMLLLVSLAVTGFVKTSGLQPTWEPTPIPEPTVTPCFCNTWTPEPTDTMRPTYTALPTYTEPSTQTPWVVTATPAPTWRLYIPLVLIQT